MSLRELEREIIEAVVDWHTHALDDGRMARVTKATEAYLGAALKRSLDEVEPRRRGPMQHPRGEGRVYRRGASWWIAYFVDGEEYRQIGGKTEGEARTALAMRIAGEPAAGVLLGPPVIETRPIKTLAETPEQIAASGVVVKAVTGLSLGDEVAAKVKWKPTAPVSHREKAKMKPCRDCGKPFQPTTAQTRCGACRDRHRLSGGSHHPRVLTNGAKAVLFADARCLECEAPFKSFSGAAAL